MGAVSSACEGCFGNSQTYPQARMRPSNKHHHHPETRHATTEDLDNSDDHFIRSNSSPSDKGQSSSRGTNSKHLALSLQDFNIIKTVGRGSFGKVYLVQKKSNRKFYALKALKKKDVLIKNLLRCTLTEKNILQDIEHPFVVQLKYSFQSAKNVYLVTDYCPGGDLGQRLKKDEKFNERAVKFYAAEVILAIQYLHEKLNIIHRDIKLDNILLDADGHIKITDFGLSKPSTTALTLCGTPDYLAPEIILGLTYGQEVDWWSLGCIIYQMLVGYAPFGHEKKDKLIESILKEEPYIPIHLSNSLKDLLDKLLKKNPRQRLGANGAEEIKKHPYFKGINWDNLYEKVTTPPFKVPSMDQDTAQFIKSSADGSLLELPDGDKSGHNPGNVNFPEFSYVGKDTINDLNETQNK